MRFRIFGQYVQGSIIALAAIEMLVLASAFAVAVHMRFPESESILDEDFSQLLPRMFIFGSCTLVGLLAF